MTTRVVWTAVPDGDWWRCGDRSCNTRFALGIAPVREGARMKCHNCHLWNWIPVVQAKE